MSSKDIDWVEEYENNLNDEFEEKQLEIHHETIEERNIRRQEMFEKAKALRQKELNNKK